MSLYNLDECVRIFENHYQNIPLIEYKFFIGKIKNSRYSMTASFYSNEKILRKDNITLAIILGRWHTKRFYPDGNEGSGFYWSEGRLGCSDISEYNMNPKEANNAK